MARSVPCGKTTDVTAQAYQDSNWFTTGQRVVMDQVMVQAVSGALRRWHGACLSRMQIGQREGASGMSMTDGLIDEELRTIIANGEDVAAAWSDDAIIAEANRRAHGRAGSMVTSGPNAAAMDHWLAVIAAYRQETDREEGAHTRVEEDVRAQLIP